MTQLIDALKLDITREGEQWHLALRVEHPEGSESLPKLAKELLVAGLKAGSFQVTDQPRVLLVEKRFHSLSEALAEIAAPLQGIKLALDARKARAQPATGANQPTK